MCPHNAAANWLNKRMNLSSSNLSSGVSLSSLVPTQLLCTSVVNKSQNVRGEGLQHCRKRTLCWKMFGNLYSTVRRLSVSKALI